MKNIILHEIKEVINDTYNDILPSFKKKAAMSNDATREVIRKLDRIDNMVTELQK